MSAELFPRSAGVSPAATSKPAPSDEAYLTIPCDCPAKRGAWLSHYAIVRCPDCGCYFWALRPERHGSLKVFPWLGDWRHPIQRAA